MEYAIGFLGYGRMARAVSQGLDRSGLIPFARQMVSGRDRARLEQAAAARGLTVAADNRDLASRCALVVLGVKPRQVEGVLEEIRELVKDQTIISLAAGVALRELSARLPAGCALVRSMPNVAALAGCGATLICAVPGLSPERLARVRDVFSSVGLCLELEEALFDAGGALSGSGPAYFFSIMESLVRGAVRLGLTWDQARRLTVQTALGAAETARQRPESPLAELRDMVTSPGGTTAEALYVFEKAGLGGIVQEALKAATDKSRNLV
ncbi:MAG: pyrroline-5-carboxylate reductase [Candidatus Adiutrix sp.]|nr:pyrroline-5-carboxylate reductase [Candidatus Adiutrix sp.]